MPSKAMQKRKEQRQKKPFLLNLNLISLNYCPEKFLRVHDLFNSTTLPHPHTPAQKNAALKGPRMCNGERTVTGINAAVKTGQPHAKE